LITAQKYLCIIFLAFILTTCKKKTSVKVTVFNYALNEPVSNAVVALIERHQGGWSAASCNEIDNVTTDANGECEFDNEKLRSKSSYDYFFAITNLYDQTQTYPCAGKTTGFITKGKAETLVLRANGEGLIVLQFNNVLTPALIGDSLIYRVSSATYLVPGEPFPFGGGGVLVGAFSTYPPLIVLAPETTDGGKKIVNIRKRKMGVVTTNVDTVKVYPNQTTTVVINW
jgi:hypothetical protein